MSTRQTGQVPAVRVLCAILREVRWHKTIVYRVNDPDAVRSAQVTIVLLLTQTSCWHTAVACKLTPVATPEPTSAIPRHSLPFQLLI